MTEDYGTAVIRRERGRLVVDRADDTIGFSLELLAQSPDGLPVDADGYILLAGDPNRRYRPVKFVPSMAGGPPTVLVCERVTGEVGEGVG